MRNRQQDEREEAQYTEITDLVARRSGMVFAPNRRVEAEGGIDRARHEAGADDGAAYLSLLRGSATALDDLVDQLTVGETHFMRNPDQMELIRREVFPPLEHRRRSGDALRVWSAGCATGEEAYSLAILLEEEGLLEGAFVLGTDLSSAALKKARAGSYSNWSMRGVRPEFLDRYFRSDGRRRVLVDRIRSKVHFQPLNLVGTAAYVDAGAFAMDLILCRNVLIYFDRATTQRIAVRLFECLAEGGVLLTAGADLLLGEYAPFEVQVTRVGLVYRRPRRPSPIVRVLPFTVEAGRPGAPTAGARAGENGEAREAFGRVIRQANGAGPEDAERLAEVALRHHPLDAHLHYLRGALLLAVDRDAEAEGEVLRALYLDRSLAVAHFLLGTILRKRGAGVEAVRAFRNARDLCAGRPPDEPVPATDGERTGALRAAAVAEMERLGVTVV